MLKLCPVCNASISNNSNQARNQIYCTAKCRKKQYRRSNPRIYTARMKQREDNLLLNDEMRYVVSQCKYAGTVQILSGHTRKSFVKTMELIRVRPVGHVHLCHIAPVKGIEFIGLLHHKNLYYGGDYQNKRFRNKYAGGGLYIACSDLDDTWAVKHNTENKKVLQLIKAFLGPVLADYIRMSSVRKSKRFQIATKIVECNCNVSIDELLDLSFNELRVIYRAATHRELYKPSKRYESKFLSYMDGLTRFIRYGDERSDMLKKLRRVMVIAYMALERVEASETFNRDFYVKYEPLIQIKYGQAMLKNAEDWSVFKDFIYDTVFEVLQGGEIDIRKFRREVMSYINFPPKAWRVRSSPWQYKMMYIQALG